MADSQNPLKRPIGPLPTWAWVAIVGAVIVGWAWWRNRQAGASSSTSSTANASQVPQFVNQTYTSVQPPSAPDTDTSREGPPGVSRVNRSPKVRHQINQIHQEHQDYEQDRRHRGSGEVHTTRKPPTRRTGPARHG